MAKKQAEQQETGTELEKEVSRIEKDYGKGSIMLLSKKGSQKVEVISSGSLKLDIATGIGGFPKGKIVEFMGWESSGKSTISLQTMANAHSEGLNGLLIDGEHSFDEPYARKLGVDMNKLYLSQLDQGGGEQCYDIAERLIRTKQVGIVIIDSQTSLLPKKALEEEDPKSVIGLHARMMSFRVPRLVAAAGNAGCLVIFVSQFREKIGIIYGSPETTSGGNALKFYAHMRVDFRKSILKDGEEAFANKTTCKIVKNKMAPPFRKAEFRINFGSGVDRMHEILDEAVMRDIVKQSGSWYSYGSDRLGQGEDNVLELMNDNPELAEDIRIQVLKAFEDEKKAAEQGNERIEAISIEEETSKEHRGETTASQENEGLLHGDMGLNSPTAEEMLRDRGEDIQPLNGKLPSHPAEA
jgi:recombination protein RecA